MKEGLYHYAEDEGAPIGKITEATTALLSLLSPNRKSSTIFESVDADEFRLWSNPELLHESRYATSCPSLLLEG